MKNLTLERLADHIHETSRTCKNEAEQKRVDGDILWDCEDCLYTARQVLFFIGSELQKGLTQKVGMEKS